MQDMQLCDLRSCKEGTQTRRMMCRSHSSVHPCNTKDITKPCWFPQTKGQGLLSSSLQPQDLQRLYSFLSGKEICTDKCSISILSDKLMQMRTTCQALGFEDSCVKYCVLKGDFFPQPFVILISDKLYSSDIMSIYLYT